MNNQRLVATAALAVAYAVGLLPWTASESHATPIIANAIIDFDAAGAGASSASIQISPPFTEDGVTIEAASNFLVLTTTSALSTGSPFLFPTVDNTEFTLTAADGVTGISLLSFDGIDLVDSNGLTLVFTGTRFDGTTASESITTDGGQDSLNAGGLPTTYNLTVLSSESFESISFVNPGFGVGIDNINVLFEVTPEPSTAALLNTILIGLIGSRRKRVA